MINVLRTFGSDPIKVIFNEYPKNNYFSCFFSFRVLNVLPQSLRSVFNFLLFKIQIPGSMEHVFLHVQSRIKKISDHLNKNILQFFTKNKL